jgi:tetratricopeptide (TPR) repeat protein
MVNCEHCQTKNSLDSMFCKVCGREVPEAKRLSAREENNRLVTEGYSLMGEGRTDEAALIARGALENDPNSAGALSLLGMVAEREGDMVAALEFYERVLILNPDSALDKVKVNQLRQALSRKVNAAPAPDRKLALAGFAAATLLMTALGAIVATMTTRPVAASTPNEEKQTLVASNMSPFAVMNPGKPTVGNQTQTQQQQTTGNPNDVQRLTEENQGGNAEPNNEGNRQRPVQSRVGEQPNWRSNRNQRVGTLPNPSANGASQPVGNDNDSTEQEVRPWVPPNVNIERSGGNDPNEPTADNRGSAVASNSGNAGATAPSNPSNEKKGVIMIRRRDNPSGNGGGGQEVPENDPNGAEAALRTGRAQQLSGNFEGAARSYEQARRMGKDDGNTNQKLAIANERRGKKSEAIAAYQRAILHLEADVRNGKPGAKEKLDSAKQALRVLQGRG